MRSSRACRRCWPASRSSKPRRHDRGGLAIKTAVPTLTHALAPAFAEWAAAWSHLGLWLSLWDDQGRQVAAGGSGGALWETLYRHSPRCRERLHHLARHGRGTDPTVSELDRHGGCRVIAVPLLHRRKAHGAVLACALTRAFHDQETLARFCDLHAMDRQVMSRLAAAIPVLEPPQIEAAGRILACQMQSLLSGGAIKTELDDLSAHLAQAYEELNLIYRISAGMTALVRPAHHLARICGELSASLPLECVVAVLEPGPASAGRETLIRAGSISATDDDLLSLYRQVRRSGTGNDRLVVVNHAAGQESYAWAASWLRHFAFYDLSRRDQIFGAILAINRTDTEDLGSYEVQLVNTVADRSAAFLETLWLYDDLESLFLGMLHALVSSIDAKDQYTCGHSHRVALLSRHLASLAGRDEEACRRVYLSGLLHDIGKIGISEAVLRKTGRLTNSEFEEMKRHPVIGARILEGVPHVSDILPGILYHHERLDGRGYPKGLKGNEVPFLGRVIGLADAFDAITTNRTYRRAQLVEVAAAEIRRCAGTQFDPQLCELLLGEDLHALHQRLNELGQQPVQPQSIGDIGVLKGVH